MVFLDQVDETMRYKANPFPDTEVRTISKISEVVTVSTWCFGTYNYHFILTESSNRDLNTYVVPTF